MKYHCLFILLFDCCNLSFHLCQSMTTAIKKINWIGFSLLLMFKQHENTNYKHPITSIKSQHKRYKYIFLCRSQTLLLWERVRTNIITRTICMTSITCTRQYFTYGFKDSTWLISSSWKPQPYKMGLSGLFYLICKIQR